MISAALRRTVRILYGFACGYCGVGEVEVGAYLTIDHFQPREAGGTDEIENLIYACHACNGFKSTAWNDQNPPVLHPLRAAMEQHLRPLSDGTLQGLTPESLQHIGTLHLNRPPLVERRKLRRMMEAPVEQETERLRREEQLEKQNQKKTQFIRRKRKTPR